MDGNTPVFVASNMNDKPENGAAYSHSLSQTGFASDNAHPRTLYVGNLDPSINDDFMHTLFAPFGRISGLKLINDNLSDPYCFIEYEDHSSAANAILTMNKRVCLDREIKVNWATSPGFTGPKQDTSKHFHIFVGDLSPEIETQQLREAFTPFGEISDCRVVRDPHTLKSKGYGFVSFIKKQDAECAISNMNGQWLGSRMIRTNWASRKPPTVRNETQIGPNVTGNRHLNYDEVYTQSSVTNCTVYCGGIVNGLCEEVIQKAFARFGVIQEIRVFKDKGYAFIKFASKEAATNAIFSMHNQEVLGQIVKCSWGKETIEPNMAAAAVAAQAQIAQGIGSPSMIYPYQQLSYWYPQAFSATGLQPPGQPFAVQAGMQYPYNQYFAQPPPPQSASPFNSASIGMSMANHGWPAAANGSMANVQNGPHHQSVSMHQNTINSAIQQSATMGAYRMHGYQAQ
ncbi:hypothetical protein RDWZM_003399 [Blomia tropicalis]|uniref:RRM domain-containing protein n=1 Tax=Blomia tropicalis TaxID=40697 RepID=A0A9Q0MFZ5_BLOTA|nr:Nucleolysin TIAR [Blomia tropicalis]KAJ6224854.1 hypothetical protein RDWZM_003399 [Blomia tropicalis]